MPKKIWLSIIKNGPLQVKNLQKFSNSRDEKIEVKPGLVLCRCGASKTKPFCDGFGIRVDKNEELTEAVIKALNYNGPSIVEIISDPLLT